MKRIEIIAVYNQGPDAVIALVENLLVIIKQQQEHIAQQQEQITQLTARVQALEERLAKNSNNSNKPPSSDFVRKNKSLREPSGKKPGGQPGHSGSTLRVSDQPDKIITHRVKNCAGCGLALGAQAADDYDLRQVFDLPPIQLEVTEHRVERKTCPCCGLANLAEFPAEVSNLTQYGSGVKSLFVYLMNYQLLPYRRTREILADLLGQSIAEGTLKQALAVCGNNLMDTEAAIKTGITQAQVGHFDETGFYVEGTRQWLHVAATNVLTYYARHRQRGRAALDAIGILSAFSGRAMHDGYQSYAEYPCQHALCNAHHLRELTFLVEEKGLSWAKKMKKLLRKIKEAVEQAQAHGQTMLSATQLVNFKRRYHRILNTGFAAEPPPPPTVPGKRGRKPQSAAKNLLDRLSKMPEQVLAFMYDFAVPFDNNQAERDLRMMKLQQKISGCFRTTPGADRFCRIRSYISSARKQGHNVFTALKQAFIGNPIVLVNQAE